VLVCIVAAIGLLIMVFFFRVSADSLELRSAVDYLDGKSKAVNLVVDCQLHRCSDVAFFLVSTCVHVAVAGATICQAVNQPGVAMEIENDRFVDGEQGVEIPISQPVRMFCARLQFEQVNDIDVTDLEIGLSSTPACACPAPIRRSRIGLIA
jgi:hypothetical protein